MIGQLPARLTCRPPGDSPDDVQHLAGKAARNVEIGTGDDDGEIGRRAGRDLGRRIDDGLRDVEGGARDVAIESLGQLLDEIALGLSEARWSME